MKTTNAVYLSGYKITGYGLSVSMTFPIAGEDASGNADSTHQIEKGDKAKELSISTNIRFKDVKDLKALIDLSEAKSGQGVRFYYLIVNAMANAVGIKQVRFQGDLSIKENDGVSSWSVSFKLIEYNSIPEKKAATQVSKPVAKQAAKGKVIVPKTLPHVATTPAKPTPTTQTKPTKPAQKVEKQQELSAFEKILKKADDALK
jgi:hypothetical protein